jgi:hypothetical protein
MSLRDSSGPDVPNVNGFVHNFVIDDPISCSQPAVTPEPALLPYWIHSGESSERLDFFFDEL